jgi:Metallo-peptidase family M12/Secretion system C-terminal sorting domain/Fibronectin type III domain
MKYLHVNRLFLWSVWCIASTCMVSEAKAQSLRPVAQQIMTASQSVDFQWVAPFSVARSTPAAASDVSETLKKATFAVLPDAEIRRLYARNLAAMRLSVPFQNQNITVDVVQVEALSDDFSLTDQDGKPLSFQSGRFYRGIVSNDVNTVVSINLFENEINGIISTPEFGNINFGKLTVANNTQDYIIYSDHDWLTPFTFHCGTETPKGYEQEIQTALSAQVTPVNEAKCVRLGWEVTNPLHIALGSNMAATTNYITSVFNNVSTLYVNDGIRVNLAQLIVWVTADNYTTNNPSTALTEYRTRRTTGLAGNLFHLIAPLPTSGGGGVAYVNVLCNTAYQYGYSQVQTTYSVVPTFSWTVEVLTHETGHNLGSPHTQSCSWPVTATWTGGALDNCYAVEGSCSAGPAPTNGGTIMSYCHLITTGINFMNGFGTEPGNLIRAKVAAASCLTACSSVTCCGTPSLFTETIGGTTTTISWTAISGATSYNIRYRIGSTGVWIPLTTNAASITLSSLTAGTTYQYEVQSVCSNGATNCGYSATRSFTTTGVITCCGTPSLFTETIGGTTTTISWTAISGATSYNIRYRIGSTGVWVPLTTNTASITLSPLTVGTTYQYEVQSVCSNGATNCGYSATRSFTTTSAPTCCGTVTNLATSSLNPSMVTFNWGAVANATGYVMELKTASMTTWWSFNNTGTAILIYGLVPNTTYQWRVRPVCTSGTICWFNGASFTTPTTCIDANEANNAITAARPMTLGAVYYGTVVSGTDDDWFKVTIPTATLFTVSLKNLANNYKLHLYNSSGTQLAISDNASLSNESISWTNGIANTVYYVLVRSSTSTTYDGYTCYQLKAATGAAMDAETFVGTALKIPSSAAMESQSIGNQSNTQLELFPNPTTGLLNLRITAATAPNLRPIVEISDLLGRKLQQKVLSESFTKDESYLLDLNDFQEGIYLVRVQLGNQVTTHKVRVQK